MTSQLDVATWVIDVLGLSFTCYTWVFVQAGYGAHTVDWCRNQSLYFIGKARDAGIFKKALRMIPITIGIRIICLEIKVYGKMGPRV